MGKIDKIGRIEAELSYTFLHERDVEAEKKALQKWHEEWKRKNQIQ